jgi:hypothetical protein
MKTKILPLLALTFITLVSGCLSTGESLKTGGEKWLFFSENATSAIDDTWSVEEEALICHGTPRGYLYTAEKYANFRLVLEYQRTPVTNETGQSRGGVLIRQSGENKIWPKCLEVQLNHPNAGDFVSIGGYRMLSPGPAINSIQHPALGEILILPKALNAEKAVGEWNRCEVTAIEGKVTVRINGTLVNTAVGCDTAAGAICLTAEGEPLRFRNISITTL